MIDLSREDWAEIYYALDSKVNLINEHSPKERLSKRWIKHLEAIMKAIGPDGEPLPTGVYTLKRVWRAINDFEILLHRDDWGP